MESNESRLELIEGIITDAAIHYSNRYETDFRKIAEDVIQRIGPAKSEAVATPFQARVQPWMMACFGPMIAGDREERNHRFLEESLELVQACGCTASEAHQLVNYVFARPVGEKEQEAGGVMVTLAALCLAQSLDMHAAGETELARIWTKVEQIREKQAAKPKHSPLPAAPTPSTEADGYKRMFESAVRDLAAISEHLGIDPDDDGGADPIIEAINDLRTRTTSATADTRLVPNYVVDALKAWTGTEPSVSALARAVDRWLDPASTWEHDHPTAIAAMDGQARAEPEWIEDPHDIEQGMMRNPKYVAPVAQGDGRTDVTSDWAVGLFRLSHNPDARVLHLSVGSGIERDEKHHSFIRWVCRPALARPQGGGDAAAKDDEQVRDAWLEEAAQTCDKRAAMYERTGLEFPEDSETRDRLFGRARAATDCARDIRALKFGIKPTNPKGCDG